MKTKQLWAGALLAVGIFASHAQNVASTSSLTSGGNNAGTTGSGGTYYGADAGKVSTGMFNTFMGNLSGKSNVTGGSNFFGGWSSGSTNYSGGYNTFLGYTAGYQNYSGGSNTLIGAGAGYNNTGSNNTYIGRNTGVNNTAGSNNVFLGFSAGYNETGSNLLFIENSTAAVPLIWGDFANDQVKLNGRVGVGLNTASIPLSTAAGVSISGYRLFVAGGILTEQIRVSLQSTWADYVFEDNYALRPLSEVECYIEENGHLPNVPSAAQVEDEGIELGEMSKIQQEKIEELTLYAIDQQKQLDKQRKEIQELKALVEQMVTKK